MSDAALRRYILFLQPCDGLYRAENDGSFMGQQTARTFSVVCGSEYTLSSDCDLYRSLSDIAMYVPCFGSHFCTQTERHFKICRNDTYDLSADIYARQSFSWSYGGFQCRFSVCDNTRPASAFGFKKNKQKRASVPYIGALSA